MSAHPRDLYVSETHPQAIIEFNMKSIEFNMNHILPKSCCDVGK